MRLVLVVTDDLDLVQTEILTELGVKLKKGLHVGRKAFRNEALEGSQCEAGR